MPLPEPVRRLADAGYAVVPAKGKQPLVAWGLWQDAEQTEGERLALPAGDAYGILTGTYYDLVVLDFDGPEGMLVLGELGLVPNVLTARGAHVWFHSNPARPVKTIAGVRPGVDVRGQGGLEYVYSMVPGKYEIISTEKQLQGWLPADLFPEKLPYSGQTCAENLWDGETEGTVEALRVLAAASYSIRNAPNGQSNAVTVKQSFTVGGLVGSGELDAGFAERSLVIAAEDRAVSNAPRVILDSLTAGARAPWSATKVLDGEEFEAVSAGPGSAPRASKATVTEPSWAAGKLPIPMSALPETIQALVTVGAPATACPPEFVVAAALAALASAIGGLVTLDLTPGWRVFPGLFLGLVGDPGASKTPALGLGLGPVRAAEDSEWFNAQGEPATRYLADDVTVEALGSLLQKTPRGLLLAVDELKGLFSGMGQYKGGDNRDRQFYLSTWSGESVSVDRIKRKSMRLIEPTLSVVGGIQPVVFDQLTNGEPDGMLERFLLVHGESIVEHWTTREEAQQKAIVSYAWGEHWNDVRDRFQQPTVVKMTLSADIEWEAWYNEFHAAPFPGQLLGVKNKIRTHVARLALILGCADKGVVEAKHIRDAVALVEWFLSHMAYILRTSISSTPDERRHVKNRDRLADYLVTYKAENGEYPSRRRIMQYGPPGSRRARDLDTLLEEIGVRL